MKNQELFNLIGDIRKTRNETASLSTFETKAPELAFFESDEKHIKIHCKDIKRELDIIQLCVKNIKASVQELKCLAK